MATNFTVAGNKEILLVAETIAHEKRISTDEVIAAMESGIKSAAHTKYGQNLKIECDIDRKSGQIKLFNQLEIVENKAAKDSEFDTRLQITLKDAKDKNKEAKIGEFISEELPPIDLSRVVVAAAKGEIIRKVKEAEKSREYEEFKDKVGEIANGVVKKVGIQNLVVDLEGFDAVLPKYEMLPKETFKVGERLRAYIYDVKENAIGAQIFLSRVHPWFVAKLFAQEVPEIYDGVIEIKNVVRDAGSRAKIAVHAAEPGFEVVGCCIGVRGSRVKSVAGELKGEKIDIIRWSENIVEFVVNAFNPVDTSKVVVDEENRAVEVIVPQDQLSIAIGRNGQNVRLISQLVGYKIDVMTQEEEDTKRNSEFGAISNIFVEALDVDNVIADLLTSEGFANVEEIAISDIDELKAIEGFDEDIASELKARANDWVNKDSDDEEEDEPSETNESQESSESEESDENDSASTA